MDINANKLFLATAVVFAVLWIICSALIVVLPNMMLAASGSMIHAELETLGWSLTGGGFVLGLVLWSLLPGITVWLVVIAYNRLAA